MKNINSREARIRNRINEMNNENNNNNNDSNNDEEKVVKVKSVYDPYKNSLFDPSLVLNNNKKESMNKDQNKEKDKKDVDNYTITNNSSMTIDQIFPNFPISITPTNTPKNFCATHNISNMINTESYIYKEEQEDNKKGND